VYTYMYNSINSLYCRGSGGASSVLGIPAAPNSEPYVREILSTDVVNGDGHFAPVHAKVVARITILRLPGKMFIKWPICSNDYASKMRIDIMCRKTRCVAHNLFF